MHYLTTPQSSVLARRIAAFAALALLASAPLGAQTTPAAGNTTAASSSAPAATPAPASSSDDSWLGVVYEHDFSASLKSGASGKMSSNRFAVGDEGAYGWGSGQDGVAVGLFYSYTNYDFSGINPEPFGNVQKLGAQARGNWNFSDQWAVFALVNGQFASETAASLWDGGQYALAAGPTFNYSKTLSISAGPMYYSRIEDQGTWTLAADAKWDFLPQWQLRAYAGVSNGVAVSYDVFDNKATVVDASVEYNSKWFRTRNVAAGGQAVDESDVTLQVGVRQALCEHCFVRVFVSAIMDREYQFHVNDQSANSFDVKPTIGLGVELGLKL